MFPAEFAERFTVRPGLTGLWQVSGRSTVGTLEMLRMDVDYVRTRRLGLDLRILLATSRPSSAGGAPGDHALPRHDRRPPRAARRARPPDPRRRARGLGHPRERPEPRRARRPRRGVRAVRAGAQRAATSRRCVPTAHRLWRRAVGDPGDLDRLRDRPRLPARTWPPGGCRATTSRAPPASRARPGPAGCCEPCRDPAVHPVRAPGRPAVAALRQRLRRLRAGRRPASARRRRPRRRHRRDGGRVPVRPADRAAGPAARARRRARAGHRPPGRGPVADRVHADRPPADHRPRLPPRREADRPPSPTPTSS